MPLLLDINFVECKAFKDPTIEINWAKNLLIVIKNWRKNKVFDGLLDKKSLKLEKKTREESCVGDKPPGLKTSQLK